MKNTNLIKSIMKNTNFIKYVEGKIDFLKALDFGELLTENTNEFKKENKILSLMKEPFLTIDDEIMEDVILVREVELNASYKGSLIFIINRKTNDIFLNKGYIKNTLFDYKEVDLNFLNSLGGYNLYILNDILSEATSLISEVEAYKAEEYLDVMLKNIVTDKKSIESKILLDLIENENIEKKELNLNIIGDHSNSKFRYIHWKGESHYIIFASFYKFFYHKDEFIKELENDFDISFNEQDINSYTNESFIFKYFYNSMIEDVTSNSKNNKEFQKVLAIKKSLNNCGKTALINKRTKVEPYIKGINSYYESLDELYLKTIGNWNKYYLNSINTIEFRGKTLFDLDEFNKEWEKNHKE